MYDRPKSNFLLFMMLDSSPLVHEQLDKCCVHITHDKASCHKSMEARDVKE